MGKVARAIRRLVAEPSPLRCAHCARERTEVKRLIAGPRIYICGDCVHDATLTFAAGTERMTFITCAFCGETARAVELGAGTRAVCGDCIELMGHILEEADHRESPAR